mmetsp:Transcript_11951/g.19428  ORF Transcript_11951/g.19428 Transcript_11951/m.19428 type:complete len:319 (-) Transcript_11951:38-994(-)
MRGGPLVPGSGRGRDSVGELGGARVPGRLGRRPGAGRVGGHGAVLRAERGHAGRLRLRDRRAVRGGAEARRLRQVSEEHVGLCCSFQPVNQCAKFLHPPYGRYTARGGPRAQRDGRRGGRPRGGGPGHTGAPRQDGRDVGRGRRLRRAERRGAHGVRRRGRPDPPDGRGPRAAPAAPAAQRLAPDQPPHHLRLLPALHQPGAAAARGHRRAGRRVHLRLHGRAVHLHGGHHAAQGQARAAAPGGGGALAVRRRRAAAAARRPGGQRAVQAGRPVLLLSVRGCGGRRRAGHVPAPQRLPPSFLDGKKYQRVLLDPRVWG